MGLFRGSEPGGSKYQMFKDSGLKDHSLNGIWERSP